MSVVVGLEEDNAVMPVGFVLSFGSAVNGSLNDEGGKVVTFSPNVAERPLGKLPLASTGTTNRILNYLGKPTIELEVTMGLNCRTAERTRRVATGKDMQLILGAQPLLNSQHKINE
ncbi:hypothetical protein Nepgr_001942 [Nepenthes gracilis]|uniref:Uncharacterized protein n=1 Tax=Nepenthes gracilis TaxID=150966 RepID=A0AAD3P611_NEPGR|nr:hypothetical protein Nepgr_001942 [Nepenthes gracilis]